MKKLAFKIVVLVAVVAVVLVGLNTLYVRTNGYHNAVRLQGTDRLAHVPGGLHVVNLGSSHGQWAFDYGAAGEQHGFNLALDSQDFYYDYQVLKHFRDRLAPGCVVLIPVSYFSFGFDEQKAGLNYDYRYYGILPYSDIRARSGLDYLKYRWCPVLFSGTSVRWLVRDEPPNDHPFKLLAKNKYSADSLKSVGRRRAEEHLALVRQPKAVFDYNTLYLEKLVAYCQQQGLKPVLVTTPYTSYYFSHFSQAFLNDFHARVAKVQERYGVPYLNYSHDKSYWSDLALFVDSDHLNVVGRKLFTRAVLDRLEAMGIR